MNAVRLMDDRGGLLYVPDDDLLPEALHAEAEKVRAAEERLERFEDAHSDARAAVESARAQDAADLKDAILNDKPVPSPNAHEIAARRALAQAEAAHRIAAAERKKLGNSFIKSLREHRGEIAPVAAEAVIPAARAYLDALEQAERLVREAASTLSDRTSGLSFVEDLDSGGSDVGMAPRVVPMPEFGSAKATANALADEASKLVEGYRPPPRERQVKLANGTDGLLPVDLARSLYEKGVVVEFVDGFEPPASPVEAPAHAVESSDDRIGRRLR